ncbi:helix-turn-helix domain-containing protein [Streptomyces griseoviridis]|uniref:helix-turn-helix domain-containing protein n=1 Tax=Streptomyces griseoviridis TaxID=45398 RepID=UPI0033C0A48C
MSLTTFRVSLAAFRVSLAAFCVSLAAFRVSLAAFCIRSNDGTTPSTITETSCSRVTPEESGFGPLLRLHRRSAGLTLEELAERAGVSVRAIGDMERGRSRSPQARTVTALAGALRLEATDRAAFTEAARAGRRRPEETAAGWCPLPPDVPDFTGRDPETAWLLQGGQDTPLTVVSGAPGTGKSALAVHAARQAADRYRDGCFFLDLRGLDAEPLPAGEALLRLLKALGVRGRDIPADTEERAALHRALLRDRRALVVLDNAAREAQVRPLLPVAGLGAVWVTARRALTGLEHARRLPLGPLPAGAATAMLGSLLGARTTSADAGALAEIAGHCGRLPLALRIAGTRLLSRPGWTARDLADRLAAQERRLDGLAVGDLHIESAFALSHAQLNREQRLLFRRLALVPGPDFGGDLAAVLTGFPAHLADQFLDDLVELGLLVPVEGDRAAFHDLIRLFAARRLREEESPEETRAVGDRLSRWLLNPSGEQGG